LVAAYPKGDHPQVLVERAIAGIPEAEWPLLIAGARLYATRHAAKPTTHPRALDRFVRDRLFLDYEPKSTGPPTVFIEAGTPEWDARVRDGHKASLRTRGMVGGRSVEGWHFAEVSKTA
jgi:hypothetical protein